MLRSKYHKSCAVNCIGPCSKSGYRLFRIFYSEFYFNPLALANPVALHYLDPFRPVLQLFNILKGDIAFVGPRAERIELVEQYKKFPYYEIRHIIKPGITGWAQIYYRPSASLEEAFEKFKYDIYYIKNRSLFLDLFIIFKTIRYVFTKVK